MFSLNTVINKRLKKYTRASILRTANPQCPLNLKALANRTSFVYPRIGVHFDRIAKNANTFVYVILNQVENGYDTPLPREVARHDSVAPIDMPVMKFGKVTNLRHLIVVRNPFDRALSLFLNKVAPGHLRQFSRFGGYGEDSVCGFKQFLTSLSVKELRLSNTHMWTQSESLTLQNPSLYTDIIYFERLNHDFNDFILSLGVDSNVAPVAPSAEERDDFDPSKRTNASQKLMNYFDKESVQLVTDVYASDFYNFGYSRKLRY